MFAIALLAASEARASLITLASDPALSGSTLIDFNSEPTANFGGAATISGVTFGGVGEGTQIFPASGFSAPGGTGQILSNNWDPEAFHITFPTPVSAFGMLWLGSSVDWTVSLYDSSNGLIETLSWPHAPTELPVFYGAKNNNIASVFLAPDPVFNFDVIGIDDFRYVPQSSTPAPVPEPGSLMLLATGLGFAGRFTKKRGRETSRSRA